MTPNEKKALVRFKEIKEGNTVTIAGRLRSTIGYAGEVCKKLWEKGHLEKLLPGQFAAYKITSSGEEQVEGEVLTGNKTEVAVETQEEETQKEDKALAEDIYEYECISCGVVIKEKDVECPRCGVVFEGEPEEEEAAKDFGSSEEKLGQEAGASSQPSVPEDWKTCNWKWK